MSDIWDIEDIRSFIDMEGFDYFFRHYISSEDLPEGLQQLARDYINAADALEKAVEEY